MTNFKLPIVLFAGSPEKRDELMEYADVDYKGQIEIHDKTMLNLILQAVYDSGMYSYVMIAGFPEEHVVFPEGMNPSDVEFYPLSKNQVDNLIDSSNYILEKSKNDASIFPAGTTHGIYIMADLPAITGDAINRYIANCGDRSASFYYSVVDRNVMDQRFPNNGRTYVKIENKYLCGGDCIMVEFNKLEGCYSIIKLVGENRKSFAKGLFLASPWLFLKFILKRINFKDVEKLMSKIFKIDTRLVISEDAEIAFDVDKPFQLELMREHFHKTNLSSQ